jgi:hypothetical protein
MGLISGLSSCSRPGVTTINFRSFNILETAFVSADSHGAVFAISLNQDSILALALAAAESFLAAKFPALGDQHPCSGERNPYSPWQANNAENRHL